jgi:hypothetical protein
MRIDHPAGLLSYRLPCPGYALSGRERRGDGVGRGRAAESMQVSVAGLLPTPRPLPTNQGLLPAPGHFASFLRGRFASQPAWTAALPGFVGDQVSPPLPPRAIAACLTMPFPRMPHARLHPCTSYLMTGPVVSLSHCVTSLINSDQPGYSGIVSLACGPFALSTLSCYSVSGLVFNRARSPWRLPWRTGT